MVVEPGTISYAVELMTPKEEPDNGGTVLLGAYVPRPVKDIVVELARSQGRCQPHIIRDALQEYLKRTAFAMGTYQERLPALEVDAQ